MSDTNSPNPDSQRDPGAGRVNIPRPEQMFSDPDADGVLMHDDLQTLVEDARTVCLSLTALGSLLRGAGSVDGPGVAELIGGVRLNAELVLEGVQHVYATVGAWG